MLLSLAYMLFFVAICSVTIFLTVRELPSFEKLTTVRWDLTNYDELSSTPAPTARWPEDGRKNVRRGQGQNARHQQQTRLRREAMEHMVEHHPEELEKYLQRLVEQQWIKDDTRRQERRRRDADYQQHLLSLHKQLVARVQEEDMVHNGRPSLHRRNSVNKLQQLPKLTSPVPNRDVPNSRASNGLIFRRTSNLPKFPANDSLKSVSGTGRIRRSIDYSQIDNVGGHEIVGLKSKRYELDSNGNELPDTWSKYLFYTHQYETFLCFLLILISTWIFCFVFGIWKFVGKHHMAMCALAPKSVIDQYCCCRDQYYGQYKHAMELFGIQAPTYEQFIEIKEALGMQETTTLEVWLRMVHPDMADGLRKFHRVEKQVDDTMEWIDEHTGLKDQK